MGKAEIRPLSSSAPEPLASAIKQEAAERAAQPRLPITDAPAPHQVPTCWAERSWDPPGPPVRPPASPLAEVLWSSTNYMALVLSLSMCCCSLGAFAGPGGISRRVWGQLGLAKRPVW